MRTCLFDGSVGVCGRFWPPVAVVTAEGTLFGVGLDILMLQATLIDDVVLVESDIIDVEIVGFCEIHEGLAR
jgi:hypothetical protein